MIKDLKNTPIDVSCKNFKTIKIFPQFLNIRGDISLNDSPNWLVMM